MTTKEELVKMIADQISLKLPTMPQNVKEAALLFVDWMLTEAK